MNKNLNLVKILKDCPKGMELDCTMFDNVTFEGIVENRVFPIRIIVGGGTTMVLTKYGQYTDEDFAKCVIFPKGETTWEGFVPPHKFKDGGYINIKDQDIWELAPDKKQRFDLKTLQPFDKVLVKVGSYWRIELFSHMYEYKGDIYYACARSSYKECIPYNGETKHLVNTSEEAPKFYRNWEDW